MLYINVYHVYTARPWGFARTLNERLNDADGDRDDDDDDYYYYVICLWSWSTPKPEP